MLSIIICHRNIELLNQVKQNIAATCGVPYELIIIDNTKNEYSIFSAYNEGVKRAKYQLLCFTHEDIHHHLNNWGVNVVKHFDDGNIGMIGVSGGTIQSHIPSSWWYNHYIAAAAVNVIMAHTKEKKKFLHYNNPGNNTTKAKVVVIDGLWFCMRRSLFTKIRFDDKTFDGFHVYDVDISLQANQYSGNYVVFNILIEHIWAGTINKKYYYDLIKLSKKWQSYLPVSSGDVSISKLKFYYWYTLRNFILHIEGSGFEKHEINFLLKEYLPALQSQYPSAWFQLYFNLSKVFGFKKMNSLFFRLEKLAGYSKLPGYVKIPIENVLNLQHIKDN